MKVEIHTTIKSEKIGPKLWLLLEDFKYSIERTVYTVPKGFVWDGNSTPRAFWSLCSPASGSYSEAGLVHDWLYSLDSVDLFTRKTADKVHRALGLYRGAYKLQAETIYMTLRAAGKSSYKQTKSIRKINNLTAYEASYARFRVKEIRGY